MSFVPSLRRPLNFCSTWEDTVTGSALSNYISRRRTKNYAGSPSASRQSKGQLKLGQSGRLWRKFRGATKPAARQKKKNWRYGIMFARRSALPRTNGSAAMRFVPAVPPVPPPRGSQSMSVPAVTATKRRERGREREEKKRSGTAIM